MVRNLSHSFVKASSVEDRRYARSTIVLTRPFFATVSNVALKMKQKSLVSWLSVHFCLRVLPHLVITVPKNGMKSSCSSSMVKDKLGWTLLSTWRKSVADSRWAF